MWLWFALAVLLSGAAAYMIGSLNPAIIISTMVYHKDIRECGSGNAGMTNMLRTFGKTPAIVTLSLDFVKGVAAVLISRLIMYLMIGGLPVYGWQVDWGGYIGLIFAIVGHIFPLFYGFKGGKGVMVTAGTMCTFNPVVFFILLAIFLVVLFLTKYVSLGSVIGTGSYPVVTTIQCFITHVPVRDTVIQACLGLLAGLIVVFMHRENIVRLVKGTEPKIGQKSSGSGKEA